MPHLEKAPLREIFADFQKTLNTSSDMLSNKVAHAILSLNIFSTRDLAVLFNCSDRAIAGKAQRWEQELEDRRNKAAAGIKIDDLNPEDSRAIDDYSSISEKLKTIIDSKSTKDGDRIRACEVLARFAETKSFVELKTKYEMANGLIDFLITRLIPEADKRARQTIRTIQNRIKNGEDVEALQFSLRSIFIELLPSAEKISDFLKIEGMLKVEG